MSWIDELEALGKGGPGTVTMASWELAKLIAAARWAEAQVAVRDMDAHVQFEDWLAACVVRDAAEAAYRAVRDK